MGEEEADLQVNIELKKLELQRELETQKIELERYKIFLGKEDHDQQTRIESEKLALQRNLEKQKAELEREKNNLDYRKFVLGSVFVALAIAAIPPLFQLATAALEYVKSSADRQAKQQVLRDDYNKEFINNALNQDIELRIRFAQYLARVTTEPYRQDWRNYLKDLKEGRDGIRTEIDKMEARWRALSGSHDRDEIEIARLERNLEWAYKEVGYVAKNRSAVVNPRTPESSSVPMSSAAPALTSSSGTLHVSRFADPVYFLLKPFAWVPKTDQAKKYDPVEVPAGFVFTLDSVPRAFWSVIRPDANASASIIQQYLYWTQTKSREASDEIFRMALQDSGADSTTTTVMYQAARNFGQASWDENAKLKAEGEKRILKKFPTEPNVLWVDWKSRSDVFQ